MTPQAVPPLPSIRARLTRLLVGLAVAWVLVVAAAVWLVVQEEVDELMDDSLQAAAAVLAGVIEAVPAGEPIRSVPSDDARFVWQVVGAREQVLQRAPQAPVKALLLPLRSGFADAAPGWRVHGLPLSNGRMLYVAQSRTERDEARLESAASAMGAALLVFLVSAWWLGDRVRRELQPLEALRQALAGFEPLQAAQRLPAPTRSELAPVHQAIEDLGRRLAHRLAGERAFSAHAAHALRTPLAGIDAQLAVAWRESAPAQQERLLRLRAATAHLARVVAALLTLFRSGSELRREPVDMARLVERLAVAGLDLRVRGTLLDSADPDLLAAVLLNLFDNSLRHGARQVQITVSPQALHVQDDGPGVDATQRARLRARLQLPGAMLDEVSQQGALAGDGGPSGSGLGLGLVLAERVARAHGGSLSLPETEQGFAVVLDWSTP